MKYIIMCGGNYNEWETPRQLLKVDGEAIVDRTIRLLRENGVRWPYISTNDKRFETHGLIINHDNKYEAYGNGKNNGRWTDCFYPTIEPCCYLFGDVVFSPEAIRTIIKTETDDIELFASAKPFDKRYPKTWAEPFALKVEKQLHLRAAIAMTDFCYREGMFRRKPIMWELWQTIKGTPFNEIITNYTVINDYTCDVDSPGDLEKIQKAMKGE